MNALKDLLQDSIPAHIRAISWELGCGHGHFLTKFASLHPERFFIGIDLLGDRLRKAGRKQAVGGVTNLRFVKAEADEFLACLSPAIKIEEAVILFPDPWPKRRHHKNRIIQDAFLEKLAHHMAPGGRLYFRTDHEPYLVWTHDKLSLHQSWKLLPDAPWILEEQTVFQARAASFGSLVAEVRTPASAEKSAG